MLKRSRALSDRHTRMASRRDRIGLQEAPRRACRAQPPSTLTARHSRSAEALTSASSVSLSNAFFISSHLLIVGLSKSTRILRHHHSRRGPAVSNSTCFLRVGLSKRPTECRAARQTRPRPAGTPKVQGLATATALHFNQGRGLCGGRLNIGRGISIEAGLGIAWLDELPGGGRPQLPHDLPRSSFWHA